MPYSRLEMPICNVVETCPPDHVLQRVSRIAVAVASPNTVIAPPTSANNVQAGASDEASHQPPIATVSSRMVEDKTGPPTFAAPCEAKYRQVPIPKKPKPGPAQAK